MALTIARKSCRPTQFTYTNSSAVGRVAKQSRPLIARELDYSRLFRLCATRRMTDPPYAPANPGRNARNDPYTCARDGFTVSNKYAANSVSGINIPTVNTQRQGHHGRNKPRSIQEATTSSAVNSKSFMITSADPVAMP